MEKKDNSIQSSKNKTGSFLQNKSSIIINADDFGITPGVNKAITVLAKSGIITSTTVMSNIPYSNDIVKLKNKIGIGVHLNLTVGKPLTAKSKISTLIDNNGFFLNLSHLLIRTRQGDVSTKEVETEFDAQIKYLIDLGINPDHIDSHQSLLKYPFFIPIIKRVAKKYDILAVRTYTQRKFDYNRLLSPRKILISLYLAYQKRKLIKDGFHVTHKYDSLLGINLTFKTAIQNLRTIFNNLPNGTLEIAVHPGYCNSETKALGKYINEREIELKALLSIEFNAIRADCDANYISFKDLS